jgi:LAO/AO transport system ATPase
VLDSLVERFHKGDRLALSRLLSHAARGEHLEQILTSIGPPRKSARLVAVTGSAGVGKSTLLGKLIEQVRKEGLTVAVLACDPQSPLSGGALLGDRFRMPAPPNDDGLFIRSLSAPGGHGAIAQHITALVAIFEAFGFDVIFLETVGAGQGDTVVRDLVDVVVLLLQPETGDDLQWEKAGVLEIADIVAIHKADLAGAERLEAQVRGAMDLVAGKEITIVRVSSKTGEGIKHLWDMIARLPLHREERPADGRDLLHLAQELLADRFAAAANDPALQRLIMRWRQHRLSAAEAERALLELLNQFQLQEEA